MFGPDSPINPKMSPQYSNLQSLFFFDIVTVRENDNFASLPEEVQLSLMSRFQSEPRAYQGFEGLFSGMAGKATAQEAYHRQGMFFPEVSKIIGITTGMFVTTGENGDVTPKIHTISLPGEMKEKTVIRNFYSLVERIKAKRKEDGVSDITLATFNGKRFDVPFLSKRSLVNNIEIPSWIQTQGKKPWEHPVLDVMESWDFGGRYDYTSLANMAYAFGIRDQKFIPYHTADNLYHTTPQTALLEVNDTILAGSYNEVIATMRLTKKLAGL